MKKNNVFKIFGFILTVAIIIFLFEYCHLSAYLSIDGFNHYNQQILAFEEKHIIQFILIYVISYIVLIAICIPGTILFDLLAGFLFGIYLGSLLVIFSYLIGATCNYLLARFFLRDFISQKFGHLKDIIIKNGDQKALIRNLIGLRFIPAIPFWLLNILSAVLDIPLKVFIWTTFIGIIPTSVIYVMIGHGVRDGMKQNRGVSVDMLTNPKMWLPLILLAALLIVPNIVKRFKSK
ncbi:MAG: VTT domain-containing protein [Burkholderiales bacterium]|nr:VTT domain-containing protein [Burkholderiales bacterium]